MLEEELLYVFHFLASLGEGINTFGQVAKCLFYVTVEGLQVQEDPVHLSPLILNQLSRPLLLPSEGMQGGGVILLRLLEPILDSIEAVRGRQEGD